MKVAILTFHRAHNYGSILQSYALQQYVISKGHKCEIIDFSNENQQEMYRVFKKRLSAKNIIKNAISLITYSISKREYDDFEKFIETKLILSAERYKSSAEMKKLSLEYDLFIAGSDQIWNLMCGDADDAYYLDFIENKTKVAYAPSFGAQNIMTVSSDPDKYADLIRSFDAVSIREKNGKKWIKELTGLDVPLLIDPTMFYDKEYWYSLMSEPLTEGKFILYYSFHFTDEINKAVHKISKKLGLPVIVLSSHAWVYNHLWSYGFRLARHAGPSEFLRLVNDAEIIISNSFHGTVFSTIYEKNFWFLYGEVQDELDDRATTMVEQMGIQDRIITLDKIDTWNFYKKADYSVVRENLLPLRKQAFKYLDRYL